MSLYRKYYVHVQERSLRLKVRVVSVKAKCSGHVVG